MKDVALSSHGNVVDFESFNQLSKLVNQHEKEILEEFKTIENRYLGDLNTVMIAKELFINWRLIRQMVFESTKNGNLKKAANITQQEGAVHVAQLQKSMGILKDFAFNKAIEFNETASFRRDNALYFINLVIVIALVLVILITFLITRAITKPINSLLFFFCKRHTEW